MARDSNNRPVGAFQREGVPGVTGGAVAGGSIAAAPSNADRERVYDGFTRSFKITNRAEKGPMKGQPFCMYFNGQPYPDSAKSEFIDDDGQPDKSSWLQPGESMIVPRDAALHIAGCIFDPLLPDKMEIVHRYGGMTYKGVDEGGATSKVPQMKIVGPPREFPDLLIEQVDQRGHVVGDSKSMWTVYIGKQYDKELVTA